MKTILVTGGAGFIGSNLVHRLAQQGQYRLVIVDTLGSGGQWQNLVRATVDEIVAPANLFYWLESFGEDLAAVFHLGGISATTEQDVGLIVQANHQYPVLLWRWCVDHQKRFFFASSAEVYGSGENGFDDTLDLEYLRTLRPLNPNGWSKKLFDVHVAQAKARGEKMPPQWAGLRFFNLYGPNEYHKGAQRSVLLQLYEEAAKGLSVKLFKSQNPDYADGTQMRDFIHIKDGIAVLLWLMENPSVSGIFNCGTGKAHSFNELAQAIYKAVGKEPHIKYVDMPSHVEHQYQYRTEANITRLREAGYAAPFTTLEDGTADYIQNYLSKADPYL